MKSRFLTAAAFAACITVLTVFGGCASPDSKDSEAAHWSFSAIDVQVYDYDDNEITDLTGTLRLYPQNPHGSVPAAAAPVGSITNGRISFALPNTIDDSELRAVYAYLEDEGTVEPVAHQVFYAAGLKVYNGANEYLGNLIYRIPLTRAAFLYSTGPLTVQYDPNTKNGFSFEAVRGWNCLIYSPAHGHINGSPPEGARWVFTPETE